MTCSSHQGYKKRGWCVQRAAGELQLADTCRESMDANRRNDPTRFYEQHGVPTDKQNDIDWFDPQHLSEVRSVCPLQRCWEAFCFEPLPLPVESSRASPPPQAARGQADPPCSHFKNRFVVARWVCFRPAVGCHDLPCGSCLLTMTNPLPAGSGRCRMTRLRCCES